MRRRVMSGGADDAPATPGSTAGRTPRRWGFGHADEHPYRRLTADWVKLAVSVTALVLSALHAGDVTVVEGRLARFLATLPDSLDGVFKVVLGVGTLWGVALVCAAALLARRRRLALVLALAGASAWVVARLVGRLSTGASVTHALRGVFDGTRVGPYPAVHLAVVAAVILTAEPFLSRPARRTGQVLLALAVLAPLIRGTAGVNDVFGALVVAWGVAALLHLGFGSPAGRPTSDQVQASLAELGFPVVHVELAPRQEAGRTLMVAETATGERLPVKVYGRDAADTRLLAKAWRFVAYKDSGPTLTLTRLQQVSYEALCLFAAREVGAHVPDVVVVGVAGPSAAIVATRAADSTPLTGDLPDVETRLVELWRDVARLRAVRLAHGALDGERVSFGPSHPVIDDFAVASISAPASRLDQDVAQLLVATAGVVGPAAATRAAVAGVGEDAVAASLPYLQKPALSRPNRDVVRHDKALLDQLRESVVEATGRESAPPIELRRIKPLNVAMVVAFVVAVWLTLAQIGSLGELVDTLSTASWPYLVVGFVLAQSTAFAFATTTIGTVREKIPLIPAALLQLALGFANLFATTGAVSTIMNIRFLQKQGVDVGPATSSGIVAGASGMAAQFLLFAITAFAVGEQASLGHIAGVGPTFKKIILVVVVAVAVAVAAAVVLPRLRRLVREVIWPQVVGAVGNLWAIVTSPRQMLLISAGSIGAQILYSLCLLACLAAYGGRLSFGEIVFVNTSAAFLTGLVPVPGGVGVAEATLIAGLTAFGISPEIATAAALTHRLFSSYLPPIWGSFAMRKLVRDGYL